MKCDHRKHSMTGGEKEQYSAVRCEVKGNGVKKGRSVCEGDGGVKEEEGRGRGVAFNDGKVKGSEGRGNGRQVVRTYDQVEGEKKYRSMWCGCG